MPDRPISPVAWQLEYPDGLLRTEPPEQETILHAPKGYVALRLIDFTGQSVCRIEIPSRCRALFMRVYSSGGTDTRGEAIVFGYGLDPEYLKYGEEGGGKLFMWDTKNNQAVNCPPRWVKDTQGGVRHQLTAPVGY